MRPTFRLFLQRAWHALEPVCDFAAACLPDSVKIILFRALVKKLNVRAVTVEGEFGRFTGDPLDLGVLSEYMLTGTYSPKMMGFLQDWFRRFGLGTMVDVGANIGLTTVPLAKAGIDCICFEPDINNFTALEANTMAAQSAGSVQLFNVAAFESDGSVSFEMSDWNHGDHRIRLDETKGAFGEQNRAVTSVAARRLDGMINVDTLRRPLMVKIDTQGGEVHVLKGGIRLLSSADLLSLEFCPYLVRRAGQHENTLIDFVENHFAAGYVGNWHVASDQLKLLEIDEIVAQLRSFSKSVQTTEHIDLLLLRDKKFAR